MITEVHSKKILTFHDDPFPTHWDINPYRGCTIGCSYCFAQYTHKYLEAGSFFKDIFVKVNADECLQKEFSVAKWKKEQVKIGGTTDLYQHIESRYKLIPKLLKVIKRHRNPVFIQTKSTLILRDLEQISQLSQIVSVDIASSVSTSDEAVRKIIEPGASPTAERINMLGKFKDNCRSTILGIMPIIPYITDSEENLESIFYLAKQNNVDHIVTSFLFLRGEVKFNFFKTIEKSFPDIYQKIKSLYKTDYPPKSYLEKKKKILHLLKLKYDLNDSYLPVRTESEYIQTSLF